jgi:protein involved in polysaccharide export with SLBB domain
MINARSMLLIGGVLCGRVYAQDEPPLISGVRISRAGDEIQKLDLPCEEHMIVGPAYRVAPPDLVRIEVLEALPGRPITGDRLIRPDGTISLDFYGVVKVAGLTLEEIKIQVIEQLRKMISDESLGLFEQDPESLEVSKIAPVDSNRVFVDVAAYNSKNYYVQGDVAAPGRLIWTGGECVLDAINYVGGLSPYADRSSIQLVRLPRGPGNPSDKPLRLAIDFDAIQLEGDPSTNYQIFPGDRIMVYRDPKLVDGNAFTPVMPPHLKQEMVTSRTSPNQNGRVMPRVSSRGIPMEAADEPGKVGELKREARSPFDFDTELVPGQALSPFDVPEIPDRVLPSSGSRRDQSAILDRIANLEVRMMGLAEELAALRRELSSQSGTSKP